MGLKRINAIGNWPEIGVFGISLHSVNAGQAKIEEKDAQHSVGVELGSNDL